MALWVMESLENQRWLSRASNPTRNLDSCCIFCPGVPGRLKLIQEPDERHGRLLHPQRCSNQVKIFRREQMFVIRSPVCGVSIRQIQFHTSHPPDWIKASRDPVTTRDDGALSQDISTSAVPLTLELQPGVWRHRLRLLFPPPWS